MPDKETGIEPSKDTPDGPFFASIRQERVETCSAFLKCWTPLKPYSIAQQFETNEGDQAVYPNVVFDVHRRAAGQHTSLWASPLGNRTSNQLSGIWKRGDGSQKPKEGTRGVVPAQRTAKMVPAQHGSFRAVSSKCPSCLTAAIEVGKTPGLQHRSVPPRSDKLWLAALWDEESQRESQETAKANTSGLKLPAMNL